MKRIWCKREGNVEWKNHRKWGKKEIKNTGEKGKIKMKGRHSKKRKEGQMKRWKKVGLKKESGKGK